MTFPFVRTARWRTRGAACSAVGALTALAGCYAAEGERLTCDDVLPPGTADFRDIQALVLTETGKGCLDAPCHNGNTARQGIRLDTPKVVFEEFSTRPGLYYATLASGEMPEHGTPWSDEDLRLLRSWYCDGAFPP